MNIQLLTQRFLRTKAQNSAGTASTYHAGIKKWVEFAEEHELDPLSTDAVIGFHRDMLDDKMALSTVKAYMAGILGLLEYLHVEGEEHDVNIVKVRYVVRHNKGKRPPPDVAQLDGLRKKLMPSLISHFENYVIPEDNDEYNRRLSALRDVALFWTLYETAGRIGEVRRLDRKYINTETNMITVIGKGNRNHKLRFGYPEHRAIPAILAYLNERTDKGKAVFVAHSRNRDGKRLSLTSLSQIISREMRLLGFPKEITAHDIRHYRAATMLKKDMPMHVIQQFLNHQDIGTTRKFYAPITDEEDMKRHLSRLTS